MFKIDPEVCTGCGNCEDCCPCGAIHKDDSGEKCVIDRELCAECGSCVDECPFAAIAEVEDEE